MTQSMQHINKTSFLTLSISSRLLSIFFLFFIVNQLINFSAFKTELIVAIAIYSIALSLWSKTWLIILPALLPVLDLTPWSGRILITEFDLFLLSSLAVSLVFNRYDFTFIKTSGAIKWVILLLIASYSISTLIGFFSLKQIHTTSFYLYLTEFNSLRVAKGFFSALFFLPILAYEKNKGTPIAKILSIGIILGLVLAIISIIWDRLIFPGFFDFSNTYRISGLFSGMLLGGAMVDSYLLLAFPFFYVLFYSFNKPWLHLLGIIIFIFGLYGIFATFTLTNYLAVFIVILILALGSQPIRQKKSKSSLFSFFIFSTIAVLISFSILKKGKFEHWSNANQLKNDGITAFLFGNGKGSYPNAYFNNDFTGLTMARFWLQKESSANSQHKNFLRFSPSDESGSLKIIQRFPANQTGTYKINITLRNHSEKPQKLLVEFCNKNILASTGGCQWRGFVTQSKDSNWQTITKNLPSDEFHKSLLSPITPVDINILNRGLSEKLDISQVEIIAPNGKQILKNSQFNNGFDYWHFSSDNHMAWHVKNLWVSAFFEGGIIEALLISILLLSLWIGLFKQSREGNHYALVLLAAISGMTIVGLFGSPFDDPRISWFFFIIIWLAILKPEKEPLPKRTKSTWLFSGLVIIIAFSISLVIGLYVINKLDYSAGDVINKFIEKTSEKLDIETGEPYQVKLNFPQIKQWRGQGANSIYSKVTTKYNFLKKPLAISEHSESTVFSRFIQVTNKKQLIQAIREAKPGDGIELQPGIYSLSNSLNVKKNASSYQPIIIYAKTLGDVLLEFDTRVGFKVNAENWTFQNLIIKGDCEYHDKCDHAFHIIGNGNGTIIRNNIIYDFNAAIKANGSPQKDGSYIYPDNVLVEKNSFSNTSPRDTSLPVTTIDVVGGNNFRIKANLISDFIKLHGDKVSYAAFLKGYGKQGLFEENLVICNMNLHKPGHTQVGLSLGGGGTGSAYCFDKKCEFEHDQGVLQNNIIMNCNDVGIYINKGKDTQIINNTLYNTSGIDIRFPQSNALLVNNLISGKVRTRNKATVNRYNNFEADTLDEFNYWFSNPAIADFSLLDNSMSPLPLNSAINSRDYCATLQANQPRIPGATTNTNDVQCINILKGKLPILLPQFNEQTHKIIKQQQRLQQLHQKEKNLKKEITLCHSCEYTNLENALKAIKTNGTIFIDGGKYETCGYIKRPVRIIGKKFLNKPAHLTRKACNNKAALVINAPNVTIENIEISNINVKDNNGACIRAEGKASNLLVMNVNCHDSQAGIIANIRSGKITLKNSVFEGNGFNEGKTHNVSINSKGSIEILNSKILSTKAKGHSLQINAPHMLIDNCVIATLNSNNSRALDNTIGGELIVKNSIIQQGPNSDNNEMIAFSLGSKKTLLAKQTIFLENNQLIFDKKDLFLNTLFNRKILFKIGGTIDIILKNNMIIGMGAFGVNGLEIRENTLFDTREEAGLPPMQ